MENIDHSSVRLSFLKGWIALLVVGAAFASHGAEALPPLVPRLEPVPQIDGVAGEEEWKDALDLGILQPADKEKEMPETRARIALGPNTVYLLIRCEEPSIENLKTVTIPDEVDAPVWKDDSVEVVLDAGNTGRSSFRLIANSAGTVYDAMVADAQALPTWESDVSIRTRVESGRWTVEMALPMASLGHTFQRGEVFKVNVRRYRHVDNATPQTAALAAEKQEVEVLVEGPIVHGCLSLLSTRRGPFYRLNGKGTDGTWAFQVLSHNEPSDAELRVGTDQRPLSGLRAGEPLTVTFGAGQMEAMRSCEIAVSGKPLYRSSHVPQNLAMERVAQTRAPQFESLVEPFPEGLAASGSLVWIHEFASKTPTLAALAWRTGMEADSLTPWEHYRKEKAIPLFTPLNCIASPERMELSRRYGVPLAIFLPEARADVIERGAPEGAHKGRAWFLDPLAKEHYLAQARLIVELARKNPRIQFVFAGDETWEYMYRGLLKFLAAKDEYPVLQAADREIKARFGHGTFGLPTSESDKNPFRWIATQRWAVEQMLELQREVKAIFDAEAPRLKLISWDNTSRTLPYELSRWEGLFDIVTGQLYPVRDKNRENVGYLTRLIGDLTGIKEVWPVPHVEHYAANFTPAETNELLSQVFRNGATGMHLYMQDVVNSRAGKGSSLVERIGAPERWAVTRSVAERLPLRVRQTPPDTGIFYSNTSYQGQGITFDLRLTNEPEWLYTVLGPRLHGAFRFFDENQVRKTPERLADLRVIYIPYAPIVDDGEYAELLAWVKKGGTLVVCDPKAFTFRSDGTRRDGGDLLAPLASPENIGVLPMASRLSRESAELPAMGESFELEQEGEVLASYGEGRAPAVIAVPRGKGEVIFFGQNPLAASVITSPQWISFFDALQQRGGAGAKNVAWNFRFPQPQPVPLPRPKGECLTGNFFQWQANRPVPTANAAVDGGYTLTIPGVKGSEPVDTEIAFAKGRLHDRLRGAQAANDADPDRYVVPWNTAQPSAITYRFARPVAPAHLRMFFAGTLPSGRCELSADGVQWREAARWEMVPETKKTASRLQALALSARAPVSHLRIQFDAAPGTDLTMIEVDIWGK